MADIKLHLCYFMNHQYIQTKPISSKNKNQFFRTHVMTKLLSYAIFSL